MRLRMLLLSVAVLALTFGSQSPLTQAQPVDVPAAVTDAIAADGIASVIVGVRTAFVPEGELASPAAVAAQRATMHAAVEATMGRAAAIGAQLGSRFETIPFFVASVDAGALSALAAMPDVASIEHNALDAPVLGQSVPLIGAPASWAAGFTGANWTVAVLDSGVEASHSFLTGKVVAEACYSNAGGAGIGVSACPGGVTSSVAPGSGAPCNPAVNGCYHGTHVAGIAAGANGSGGINGVAPGARLIALQVFTIFSGAANCGSAPTCPLSYVSDQILGLERVLALAGAGNANRIASANMSLGGGSPSTNCDAAQAARKAAIDNLRSINVATVIASGNNGFTTGISAPACISTAVSVGSTTKADAMSSFTNRGGGKPDILAPGSSITSSLLGNTFGALNGTSMATPHVAGAWAILKQAVPGATVAQVLQALRDTGANINDSTGVYRRINVNAARLALPLPTGAPGPPGAPTISGAGNNITIAWTAPTTGGAATSYTVLARVIPGGPLVAQLNVGNALSLSTPAPNGTFIVSIVASNASGNSPESASTTFTVPFVGPPPGAPTNLAASVSGSTVVFTWVPPTTGGATAAYAIVAAATPGGAPIASLQIGAPANSYAVPGVPAGTYYVRIAALNGGGASPFSNEVTVVVAPPGAPTLNPASVSAGIVTLSWTPGSGGATSFIVAASLTPGGPVIATLPVGATSISVPAPRGTYFVRVYGVNGVGVGPPSNEITVVVP